MKEFAQNFFTSAEFNSMLSSHNLKIVLLLAVGFFLASALGYLAIRIKVSPILGYLCAGYLIGPFSPGFVADGEISKQLAEIGIILMMFGVGLDFRLEDLMKVKRIAIPGAVTQTLISALFCAGVVLLFYWPLKSGIVLGLAIGVASTVVVVRMLTENRILKTEEGHVVVGWLIVEDIITVLILLLLPSLSTIINDHVFSPWDLFCTLSVVFVKFLVLALILLRFAPRIVSLLLKKVQGTRSHELFTLSVLAIIFLITLGATVFFGISIALGAFIVGMLIRQTQVHEKALIHSLPMKEAFISFFFLSVGMLFNPLIVVKSFPIFISVLGIILLVKPFAAFIITRMLKYPFRTALTVAAGLAQIGEFSFILAEESMKFNFITHEAYDIIVGCSLITIALNPFIFKWLYRKNPV